MGNKLPTINLIKKDQNFFDKFIVWALTIGRALVIITEIIALGAFIYRFSLDQRLVDLHDNINQKKRSYRSCKKTK